MARDIDLYFSDIFDIEADVLEQHGAFNVSLINDLPLFIDPFLLFNSANDRYQELHRNIVRYVRFLRDRSAAGEINPGLLERWFMFREVKQTWLGYSRVGNCGSGLGRDFALALHRNLHTVFSNFGAEEITRGSHLEKLCLIKSGVGRDNISDFTTHLIKDYLLDYTQDFARRYLAPHRRKVVSLPKVRFNYETRSWMPDRFELPYHNGDYVILTPKDLLTKDDTWINRADLFRDFDDIADALPNDQLRAQVNEFLLRSLPDRPTDKERNEVIARIFAEYPELIDYYIRYKEEHGEEAVSVSELRVREVEQLFIRDLTEFIETLHIESRFYATGDGTFAEARARVMYLKDVIENKGGHRLFHANGQPIRRESDLQLLFRLTWFATPVDISREVNDGRGPVDFKVSRGRFDKSLVEFKLASNSHLRRNLEKQVAIYEKASDAPRSLRVILYFTDSELRTVEQTLKELDLQGHPDIILIDGRDTNKPSGSKA